MDASRIPERAKTFSPRVAGACAVLLLLTPFLRVEGENVVIGAGSFQTVVPGACLFRILTGLDCPFCGLSRGFVHAAHGQFEQAWRQNWASLPGLILVVGYALGGLLEQFRRRGSSGGAWSRQALFASKTVLAAVLGAGWLAKML